MADYNSSLPVRTQTNGDVVVFIADGTTPSQVTAVDTHGSLSAIIRDASGNAVTSQANGAQRALDVGINVAGVQIDPRSIRALTASDVVTANQGTAGATGWLITGTGTAGTPAAGVVTIQGIAGGTAIPVSGTITATNASIGVVGTTPPTSATYIGGSVTTAAPTYVTGNMDPLSLTTAGALRVDGSAVTQPVSGTVAATQSGAWNITNITGTVSLPTGASTSALQSSVQGSATGGTAATSSQLAGGIFNTVLPTLTNGQQSALQLDSSGRLLIGSIAAALPAGANTIGAVNQGTAAVTANAWPIKVTDGTNTAAVKAASTAALATDPSLVVALSPNSPLPAGTNALGSVLANLQVASAAVSATNPVPVTISDQVPGTPIQNYQTSVALAAGASATFTYTVVAAHTFTLQRVWASASGKIKAVVANNGTTIFVGFNSTANPNIDITITTPPTIAAGNTVTVTITNDDKAAFDVYATIEGNQN